MKKKIIIALFTGLTFCTALSALSYTDNVYQRRAEEYLQLAEDALSKDDLSGAVDNAEKAKENAALSIAFVDAHLAILDGDDALKMVKKAGVISDKAQTLDSAEKTLGDAKTAFDKEDFAVALAQAQAATASLLAILNSSSGELPEYYIVQTWEGEKDCFWNISAKSYVYNNPFLWKHLYWANKQQLEDENNPDLIQPGMKIKIPSIAGEKRSGVYDKNKKYGVFKGKN